VIAYDKVDSTRRLIGGERFQVVVVRDPPIVGMSRIDKLQDAYYAADTSRWLYTISPPPQVDDSVGSFVLRARMEASQSAAASVGQAFNELQTHLGFYKVTKVTSVDSGAAAADVQAQARAVDQAKAEGAGASTAEKLKKAAASAADAVTKPLEKVFGLVQLALVAAVVVGGLLIFREYRATK
jgi:hypothetical protein